MELSLFIKRAKASRHYVIAIANYLMYSKEVGSIYRPYREVIRFEKTRPDLNIPSDQRVSKLLTDLPHPYNILGQLLAYSGLRLTESPELVTHLESSRMIDRGEVTVYPLGMMRGSKNAFYAYMPTWLAEKLDNLDGLSSYKETGKKFRLAGLPAKYLRKWNYNMLVRAGVDMMIAEFIQGRAFRFVGGTNYLGAMERACEAYGKALPVIEKTLKKN